MGESNAERLARIMQHIGGDPILPKNEERLWFLIQNIPRNFNGGAEAAAEVLDILYSWRTCGSCKFWRDVNGTEGVCHCPASAIDHNIPQDSHNRRRSWHCPHWEERTE